MLPRSARILIALIAGPLTGALAGMMVLPVAGLLQGSICFLESRHSCEEMLVWSLLFVPPGAFLGLIFGTPLFYYLVWTRKARGMSRSRSARS